MIKTRILELKKELELMRLYPYQFGDDVETMKKIIKILEEYDKGIKYIAYDKAMEVV